MTRQELRWIKDEIVFLTRRQVETSDRVNRLYYQGQIDSLNNFLIQFRRVEEEE